MEPEPKRPGSTWPGIGLAFGAGVGIIGAVLLDASVMWGIITGVAIGLIVGGTISILFRE